MTMRDYALAQKKLDEATRYLDDITLVIRGAMATGTLTITRGDDG